MDIADLLTFEECLKDSPRFRQSLSKTEHEIQLLQDRYTDVTDTSYKTVSSGIEFCTKFRAYQRSMDALSRCYKDNDRVRDALVKIVKIYAEFEEMLSTFVEKIRQTHTSLAGFMTNFKLVSTTKKSFERASDTLDSTLAKSASVSMSKTTEWEEMGRVVSSHEDNFFMSAFDYVHLLRTIQLNKNSHILETSLGLVDAHFSYFRQGVEFTKNIKPWIEHIDTQVAFVREQNATEQRRMEDRFSLIKTRKVKKLKDAETNNKLDVGSTMDQVQGLTPASSSPTSSRVEGYLFKKSSKKSWRTWTRKWFLIESNQLLYCNPHQSDDRWTVLEVDLRIVTARPLLEGVDRRFCFEIIVPGRTHVLQAESQGDMNVWISALQAGMSSQLHNYRSSLSLGSPGDPSNRTSKISDPDTRTQQMSQEYDKRKAQYARALLEMPGNEVCCDCSAGQPKWASVNMGVIVCTECSAVHRSFGVQVSRIRSITLDNWDPEILHVMQLLGNTKVNSVYEATVTPGDPQRPTTHSPREQRMAWLRAKWIERRWVGPPFPDPIILCTRSQFTIRSNGMTSSTDTLDTVSTTSSTDQQQYLIGFPVTDISSLLQSDPSRVLYLASEAHKLPLMLQALALGADVNWISPDSDGKTPLIKAVESRSLAACEFLITNGAKINQVDRNGQSPLHHACLKLHRQQVCLLCRRNADQSQVDRFGQTPLSIAIHLAHADIVTMLRVRSLKEHNAECLETADETVNDVFSDFILRAYEMCDRDDGPGEEDTGGSTKDSISHGSPISTVLQL